jgi:transmembrane protein TMEM260 (protein O-mannosyltransferase)
MLAALVAVFAFLLYRSTLLAGVDFGDTGSFQAAVGDLNLSPRQAYPLYFALGNLLARLTGGEPAFALNLYSAIAGALAAGVVTLLACELTGSLAAGLVGGLMLASSYTFWTQAIIAEVYALHLLLMGLVLTALLWWDRRPTLGRLAVVFGIYALSFGNHLMTVLLAPSIVLFIATSPGGLRLLVSRRVILLAVITAMLGACQYAWNASYLWHLPEPPATLHAMAKAFWFDVTKSDWRDTMVMAVHEYALKRRVGMYQFDLTQQIGVPGIALAGIGMLWLLTRPRLALLVASAWLTAFVFAYTYNVGDTHVFFLPSHQMVMLACACGTAGMLALARRAPAVVRPWVLSATALVLIAYPLWRAWDTWPAVDRHADQRPVAWLSAVARGLGEPDVLLADVNWQLGNGFDYYQKHLHPELNMVRATDAILTLSTLVHNNLEDGRHVYATPVARAVTLAAYGDLFTFTADPAVDARPLSQRIAALPAGTPYVLALLAPYPDLVFDTQELADACRLLTKGTTILGHEPSYTVMAGRVGEQPSFVRRSDLPWREAIDDVWLDVRMESWIPPDTIRRAGFGHVIAGRRHVLTLERGVSFIALSGSGEPVLATYASSLFAPLPRFRVTLTPGAWPAGGP